MSAMADGTTIHLAYGRRGGKLRGDAVLRAASMWRMEWDSDLDDWRLWVQRYGSRFARELDVARVCSEAVATRAIERRDRRLVVGSRFYETHLEVLR